MRSALVNRSKLQLQMRYIIAYHIFVTKAILSIDEVSNIEIKKLELVRPPCFRKCPRLKEIIKHNSKQSGLRSIYTIGEIVEEPYLKPTYSLYQGIVQIHSYYNNYMTQNYHNKKIINKEELGLYCMGGIPKSPLMDDIKHSTIKELILYLYDHVVESYTLLNKTQNNLRCILVHFHNNKQKVKNMVNNSYHRYQLQISTFVCIRKMYYIFKRIQDAEINVLFGKVNMDNKISEMNDFIDTIIEIIFIIENQ